MKTRPGAQGLTNVIWLALSLGVAACVFVFVMWGLWRVPAPDNAVSIAVLPFANVSTEPSQEFFSDGMTDEISGALAKIPDLRVVGRSSAFQFKGANKDLRAVGQGLGATHLIEGSVRQAGNRVRIAAQLIEAKNGLQLWSASYDRELTDVFAIQEDIATAIAGALRMPLGVRQASVSCRFRSIRPSIPIRSRPGFRFQIARGTGSFRHVHFLTAVTVAGQPFLDGLALVRRMLSPVSSIR